MKKLSYILKQNNIRQAYFEGDESVIEQIAKSYAPWFKGKLFNPFEYFVNNYKEYYPTETKRKMKAKQCFTNAAKVTLRKDATYVEGWILFSGVPIQHAWNIINGKAVDCTVNIKDTRYFGIEIPIEVFSMAINNEKAWIRSSGVMETMRFFSEEELERVKKIMR